MFAVLEPQPARRSTGRLDAAQAARLLGGFTAAVGLAVLIGWAIDSTQLKSISPSLSQMKANTAVLFTCAGVALAALQSTRTRRIAELLGAFVAVVAGLTLAQYVFGWNLGIDELLAHDSRTAVATLDPGRMGPNTALAFMFVGGAVLTIDVEWRGIRPAQVCALATTVLALVVVVGYAYEVSRLETSYLTAQITPMALHTAILFLVLATGLMLTRANAGVMASLRHPGPGGSLRRLLLPPAVILPVALGFLRLQGELADLYDTREGIALFALVLVVLLVVVIWLTARSLDRAEAERGEVLARERAVIDTALDGVISIDIEGRVVDFNRTAEEMFGITKEAAIGRDMAELIIPERLREAHRHGLARVRSDPSSFRKLRLETIGVRADGSEFAAEVAIGRPSQPATAALVGNVRDISDRKHLEEQLRQSQKLEAVGQLAGGVAHDFNNLLTVISGYTAMLRDRIGEGVGTNELDVIKRSTDRATELSQQLLAFSRKQVLDPVPLDLAQVATSLMPMLQRLIGEDIEIVVLDNDAELVLADRSQIEQVIVNLAVNARDAMPTGGKLMIEARTVDLAERFGAARINLKPGRHVCLSVTDTGTGIEPEIIEHVFEPFFTTKEVGQGSGLGLSTVHGTVSQSGGDVLVYSEPGFGTTFKIYLPVAPTREPSPERVPVVPATRAGGHETVLLCEDDENVRALIDRLLSDAGYDVLATSGPREALNVAKAHHGAFDILVSDVIMPEMSGPQLAVRLRTDQRGIPTLLISGYTADTVRDRGSLPAGASYLEKPFDRETLLARVRELLDNASATAPLRARLGSDTPSPHDH